jgi:ABC-type glycerol-3-phosphate transport system permease component
VGYFIYGKKQRSGFPMAGGVAMIVASYFAGSILAMSLICIAVMVLVYVLLRRYG